MTTATLQSAGGAEANNVTKKVETIKDTIAAHDGSLPSEIIGKLQMGALPATVNLTQTLIEDLETAPTYQNPGESWKTKGKQEKEVFLAVENRKSFCYFTFPEGDTS